MTRPSLIVTSGDKTLAALVDRELNRRKFRGHGEIQLVLSDRKDESHPTIQGTPANEAHLRQLQNELVGQMRAAK